MNEKEKTEFNQQIKSEVKEISDNQFRWIKIYFSIVILFLLGFESNNIYNTIQINDLKNNYFNLQESFKKTQDAMRIIVKSFDLQVKAIKNNKYNEIDKELQELREQVVELTFKPRGIEIGHNNKR